MRCPKCGGERSSVVDSRSEKTAIRRRRECQNCGFRFSTFERMERSLPMVVKKDLSRQSFDREKLRIGIERACEKRPITADTLDELLDRVETSLSELRVKEVASVEVGNLVMTELRDIDDIAYIRFASVYREFTDVHQFMDELRMLEAKPKQKASASAGVLLGTQALEEVCSNEANGSQTAS